MKKLLIILLLLPFLVNAQTPTANAGADQTIYLTTTNQVTLVGTATNSSSVHWTEVSTDYMSGATITNSSSKIATVTGLPQGVFYFEIAATTGATTKRDTMAVIVDYDVAPTTSTLLTHAIWSDMAYGANLRDDTTTCYSWSSDIRSLIGTTPNAYYMEKDGTLGSKVDTMRQKYYSILNDGHGCSGYGRSEIIPARHLEDWVDTSKIYVIEWKGYFPQDMSPYAISDYAGVIGQIHGNDGYSPPFGIAIKNNELYFTETFQNGNGQGNAIYNPAVNEYVPIMSAASLWNQTHTFRWIFKEGKNYTGQPNFIELKIDGVTKYYRNTGQVGSTLGSDWIKGATMYDFDNLITDANNTTRGRNVSLATESFRVYTVTDTTTIAPPTLSMAGDQSIAVDNTSTSANGIPASGQTITAYHWILISGTGTIVSPDNSSTSLTGLGNGDNVFECTATQSDGQTVSGTVTIHVTVVANAGSDIWITRPMNFQNIP